jgi:hypothetical protein
LFNSATILKSGLIVKYDDTSWMFVTPDNRPIYVFKPKAGGEPGPMYVDAAGNVYHDDKRYIFPDYKVVEPFPIINICDSIDRYRAECKEKYPDPNTSCDGYIQNRIDKLQTKAGLPDCNHYGFLATCNFFGLSNGYFVIEDCGYDFDSEFTLKGEAFEHFDRTRKVDHEVYGGRVGPSHFVRLQYLVTPKGLRFKSSEGLLDEFYNIQGKYYLITEHGMYEML